MTKEGIPSELSYSAGAYVCNDLFYRVMHYLKEKALDIPAGFIHVPNPAESDAETKSELATYRWLKHHINEEIRILVT
ncbi:pyroglutamyl-peptidase I family protein [Butyrivibrio sp. FC2001]|uniref:pyroglutamyl-peptidase I family protein n=1 Tax=Butyrivibrio sp. FC2001 TaxID=1280671 RepID=UPI0004269E2E|nr:hypothetical protein [Butyrivibrio sp. FC2001]